MIVALTISIFINIAWLVLTVYNRLNETSIIRLSGQEAKEMAREGMASKAGITYAGGALTRFYDEHVKTGKVKEKLPALRTARVKLQASSPVDQRFLKTVIKYCHGKKVEISD